MTTEQKRKQRRILELRALGIPDGAIAERLGVSVSTVGRLAKMKDQGEK